MSQEHFATFRKFRDRDEAMAFLQLLEDCGFDTVFEDTEPSIDITFTGNIQPEFRVKLRGKDFEAAEEMLEKAAASGGFELPADHYLHEFSNQELLEILAYNYEWSKNDVVAAQRLLQQRGAPANLNEVRTMQETRLNELRAPKTASREWVVAGYIFCVLGMFLVVGAMPVMAMGWGYWRSTKAMPTGELVPSYDEASRVHGKRLFHMGWMFTVSGLLGAWAYIFH